MISFEDLFRMITRIKTGKNVLLSFPKKIAFFVWGRCVPFSKCTQVTLEHGFLVHLQTCAFIPLPENRFGKGHKCNLKYADTISGHYSQSRTRSCLISTTRIVLQKLYISLRTSSQLDSQILHSLAGIDLFCFFTTRSKFTFCFDRSTLTTWTGRLGLATQTVALPPMRE